MFFSFSEKIMSVIYQDMLEKMYLKALILYLLSWTAAAFTYQPHMFTQTPPDGSAGVVVFPVDGQYFAKMQIGKPHIGSSKTYSLHIDTGSTLTWLRCSFTAGNPHSLYTPEKKQIVRCTDPICATVNGHQHHCQNPNEPCHYKIEYADHSSSSGVIVKDSFSLRLKNGTTIARSLAFGCGYDNQIPGIDGVIGLGIGNPSIVAQLRHQGVTKNIVGHCLGVQGGVLFFGDVHANDLVWTPLVNDLNGHYNLGKADLRFNGHATHVKGIRSIIFDTGSTYTYFNRHAYNAIVNLIKHNLNREHLREIKDDNTLPICWKGVRPFKSVLDAVGHFRPFALSFGTAQNVHFDLHPKDYLIVNKHGNVCLGILNGDTAEIDDNLIGDISLRDKLVIYDNERHRIGWVEQNCNRAPRL